MKILHLLPSGGYTENTTYQDNTIAAQNIKDGHEVTIITNCQKLAVTKMIDVPPEDRVLKDGIRLIRLPYKTYICRAITDKIRDLKGLYLLLEEIRPDVIRVLNVSNRSMLTVRDYKIRHPDVKVFLDSHAEQQSTPHDTLVKKIFHFKLVRGWVGRVLPYVDTVFTIGEENKEFLKQVYHIPVSRMKYFPLLGEVPEKVKWMQTRKKIRDELGMKEDDILLCHSGKLDPGKKTLVILRALQKVRDRRLKLIIIGMIPDHYKDRLLKEINNTECVIFAGWKTGGELREYLCASDLYLQPGTHSVTMQNALCCSCPIVIPDDFGYDFFMQGTGWFGESEEDLVSIFHEALEHPELLKEKSRQACRFASRHLDAKSVCSLLYQ